MSIFKRLICFKNEHMFMYLAEQNIQKKNKLLPSLQGFVNIISLILL